MRVPRQLSGQDVARALRVLGYERARQDGSHIRRTTEVDGTHHVTVPNHKPRKVGTPLVGVLEPDAAHHRLTAEARLAQLGLSGTSQKGDG